MSRPALSLLAAALLAASPAMAQQPDRARTLRVAPETLTTVLDPHFTTSFTTRDFAYLVFDTLVAVNDQWQPTPQMLERWERSADGMTWTFVLRDGLAWHDGSAVTAEDCVASLRRWGARDALGGAMMRAAASIDVVDAKTFRLVLREPFGLVLEALGKPGAMVPMMMPARLAATPPTQQVTEVMGSGPYRFVREEYRPGDRIVVTRNAAYRPRPEPAVWASGGKVARMERVELIAMPDVSTQVSALTTGEIDYVERLPADVLPILERNRSVTVATVSPYGYQGILRFNHLHPPFDNPQVRRAVMLAANQADYLAAVAGRPEYARECRSMFGCGTPLETTAGMPPATDLEAARRMLRESGADLSRPVAIIHPADAPGIAALGLISQGLLTQLGFNVDLQSMDLNTYFGRRARQEGWNLAHTTNTVPDMQSPLLNPFVNGAGRTGGFAGWPENAEVERLRREFARAQDDAARKRISDEIHRLAAEDGFYMPLGQFTAASAWRSDLNGVLRGPAMFLWNLERR
ncbi:ABC transporter substrate-binding protein [Falsiroseomonas sp.]|uniref:ABC transporter substrate-binding protein n=1 Tax=Falsiroseomonas sp. TaxID=2870721 RepID=UPI00271B658F|nr:ABC transporter substrate-binding protein [Falsiroseomonas sp.]MDO9502961.1 ABC transporter substrate-binding protein [Falsiroseomonas sp.]